MKDSGHWGESEAVETGPQDPGLILLDTDFCRLPKSLALL